MAIDRASLPAGATIATLCRVAAAIMALTIPGTAAPQTVPGAGDILRDSAQPRPSVPPAPPPFRIESPQLPTVKADTSVRVRVSGFRFSGNTVFEQDDLSLWLSAFTGKELSLDDLQEAVRVITERYRSRGYFLAQAYLPEQTIAGGTVEITVIEGRLGMIRLSPAPGVRLNADLAKGLLESGISSGEVMQLDRVERGILLLGDLPGGRATAELVPGQSPGTTDINVRLETDRWLTGGAGFDNYGSRSTGEIRANGHLSLANPLGRGDLLSVRHVKSLGNNLEESRLSYAFPVGLHGTRLTLRHTDLRYRLGGDFSALDASGSVRVEAVDLQHPFIRSRQFNVYGQLAYERKSLEDRQGATGFTNERRIAGRTIGLSIDARDGWLGGGFSVVTVAITAAELDLLTPAIALSDQSPAGRFTQGAFSKTGYTLSRMQSLGGPWMLSLNLNAQTASRNLEGSEKMALGGPGGVRAYAIGEGAADEGWITQTELRRTVGDPGGQTGLNVFAFHDQGRSRLNRNPSPADTIDRIRRSGYGLGLETRRLGSFALRATAAWRDDARSATDASVDRRPRIYVLGSLFF